MSRDLIEKIRTSRQQLVTVSGHVFTVSRPTPLQAMDWLGNVDAAETQRWFDQKFTLKNAEWRNACAYAINHFVCGWDLTEQDLIPGGTPAAVPFSTDLLNEWLLDNPAAFTQLGYEIFMCWLAYLNQRDDDEKKSSSGSHPEPEVTSVAEN